MSFNLPIENLPFVIQREIMDHSPRLPNNIHIKKLSKHISNRYCNTCGEYIDLKYINKKYPVHIHYGKKKFVINKYKYIGIYPINFLSLKDLKMNAMSLSCYNILLMNDRIPIKIYFLKESIDYFFNFKKYVNGKTRKLIQMINLVNINIFKNPNYYIFRDFNFNYNNYYFVSQYRDYKLINSDNHYNKIIELYNKLFIHNYNYYLFYDSIIKHYYILNYYAKFYPKEIIISLLNCKNICNINLFYEIININIKSLEYIPEKKLIKLYNNDPTFFHNLYRTNENVANFFNFFDPIKDTLYFRLIMYEEI